MYNVWTYALLFKQNITCGPTSFKHDEYLSVINSSKFSCETFFFLFFFMRNIAPFLLATAVDLIAIKKLKKEGEKKHT